MAELVDAMVSNTIVFTGMPVRVRLGVPQKQKKACRIFPVGFFRFWVFRSEVRYRRYRASTSEPPASKTVLLCMLAYCVYVLFSSKDYLLYIGFSSDLPERKHKHDSGGVKSTAPRRPHELIYCEYFLFKADAMRREGYFKTSMGRKAIKLMLSGTLSTLGYKGSLKTLKIEYSTEADESNPTITPC
jgi:putative endonuclease